MLRLFIRVLMSLSLVTLAAVAPAWSTTITTFTDPTSWQNASNVVQTITFEGLAPANGSTTYQGANGVTTGGAEFIGYTSSGASWIQVIDTNFSTWFNFGSSDAAAQTTDRPSDASPVPYIHVVLPAGVTAFGVDLFSVSPNALNFTVSVAGNSYTVPTDPRPTEQFFGVTSDTPIGSVDFTLQGTVHNGGTTELIDNFQYGTALDMSEAPEGATFLLIGSGLIGIAALRKWVGPRRPA